MYLNMTMFGNCAIPSINASEVAFLGIGLNLAPACMFKYLKVPQFLYVSFSCVFGDISKDIQASSLNF